MEILNYISTKQEHTKQEGIIFSDMCKWTLINVNERRKAIPERETEEEAAMPKKQKRRMQLKKGEEINAIFVFWVSWEVDLSIFSRSIDLQQRILIPTPFLYGFSLILVLRETGWRDGAMREARSGVSCLQNAMDDSQCSCWPVIFEYCLVWMVRLLLLFFQQLSVKLISVDYSSIGRSESQILSDRKFKIIYWEKKEKVSDYFTSQLPIKLIHETIIMAIKHVQVIFRTHMMGNRKYHKDRHT